MSEEEEWPDTLGPLGKVWACRSVAGVPGPPVVVVVVTAPDSMKGKGMATFYEPAQFRELVAKLQQIADGLPPDEEMIAR